MPRYDFRCPQHGVYEEVLPMAHPALDASLCPVCGDWSPRKYGVPTVQNHSKSADGLVSWGQAERPVRILKRDWLAEERKKRLEQGPLED